MSQSKKSFVKQTVDYLWTCFCVIAILSANFAVFAQTPSADKEAPVRYVYNPILDRIVSQKGGDNKNGNSTNLVQFCNAAPIVIPAAGTQGISAPYPSPVVVSGLGNISSMSLTFNNINHTFAGDIDILLVSPGGLKFVPLANVGSGAGFDTTATVMLTDSGPGTMPTGSVPLSGTYRPTANRLAATVFPPPAPAGPYNQATPGGAATFASIFNGTSAL
jgi:hypothetical protein